MNCSAIASVLMNGPGAVYRFAWKLSDVGVNKLNASLEGKSKEQKERAKQLSEMLSSSIVLCGDAADEGLMLEENVVAEAGTVHYLTLQQIRDAISELGYTPRQRNVFYELVGEEAELRAVEASRQTAPVELTGVGRAAVAH